MSRLVPIAAIVLLSLALFWLASDWRSTELPAFEHERLRLAAPPAGGDFELTAVDGPFRLSDLGGQIVLLFFGYTACPDVCPTNLAMVSLALRALEPAELERVSVVFVSVDPERDTPGRIAEYAQFFHPKIIGVTGSEAALADAAGKYGAVYQRAEQPASAMDYTVDHSAFTYLIDGAGELSEVLGHATAAQDIVAAIRRYLEPADG